MYTAEDLNALKSVLVEWGLPEDLAKDQALRLVFGYEGNANLFQCTHQQEPPFFESGGTSPKA